MEHQTGPAGTGPGVDGETGVAGEPAAEPGGGQLPATAGGLPTATAGGGATAAESTGDPRVDAALKLLDRLPDLPVSEHPELFEQVHAQLSDVLSELDPGSTGAVG